MKTIEERSESYIRALESRLENMVKVYNDLKEFIIKTSLAENGEMRNTLKQKSIELVGEGEYYARILESGIDLDDLDSDDIQVIIDHLRG